MNQIAEMIVTAARRARLHGEKMLQGVAANTFARKPNIGGHVIEANHPAFVYGHLSLYPARVMFFIGAEPGPASVPPTWADLFQPGKPCLDDSEGRIYPSMGELTTAYFRAYDAAMAEVLHAADDVFARVLPDERYRQFFPTVGAATLSMLNNHVMFHIGQVSTWRRCMGLGPAE